MENDQAPLDFETTYLSQLYLVAAISGFVIAIGYLLITVGFIISGVPLPKDASGWITYLDGKTMLWWGIIWGSIITNLLYIPIAAALYEYLKIINKLLAWLASACLVLFVFLELALTWSKYPAIMELVNRYLAATSVDAKNMYMAAIESASVEFQTSVVPFYTIFLPSIGVIIFSYLMLKAKDTGKIVPLIGIVSGLCNAVSVIGGYAFEPLKNLVVAGSLLSLFWFFGLGVIFFRKKVLLEKE